MLIWILPLIRIVAKEDRQCTVTPFRSIWYYRNGAYWRALRWYAAAKGWQPNPEPMIAQTDTKAKKWQSSK